MTTALAGLAGGATAQDQEPGLCQHFDIDAFAAEIGLEFERPPLIDRSDACLYEATDAPEGLRDLHITLSDTAMASFDRRREGAGAMGPVDLMIGEQRAFAFVDSIRGNLDERVTVDLEPAILSISLTVEEGAVPDQRGHVIRLAETVMGNLGPIEPAPTQAPEPPAPAALPVGASGVELPTVDGLTWNEQIGARGDQLAALAEDDQAQGVVDAFAPLLVEVESDLASVGILVAGAMNGMREGSILVVRIDGVDQASLDRAVPVWIAGLTGSSELELASDTIGGKAVISVDGGAGDPTHVYISGDTVYLLQIGQEYEVPVLEALP